MPGFEQQISLASHVGKRIAPVRKITGQIQPYENDGIPLQTERVNMDAGDCRLNVGKIESQTGQ
jgi:hypothetical protein